MRRLYLLIFCLLLTSCFDNNLNDASISKIEYKNSLCDKQVLVLTKYTPYKSKLVESVAKKMHVYYSFVIDDLDKIYEYSFVKYSKVLILENVYPQKTPVLETYLKNYVGVNNIIFVAVTTANYQPMKNIETVICYPITKNIIEKTNQLAPLIRSYY